MIARLGIVSYFVLMAVVFGSGVAYAWIENGDPVCTASADQKDPAIISDGHDGAIIAWCDKRGTYTTVCVQRMGPRGQIVWDAEGVAVCDTTWDQEGPQLVPDGSGGAFVTWLDNRNGNWDVYAQRIDADGDTYWGPDGVPVCTVTRIQECLQMIPDGEGGVIITWHDRNDNVYTQKLNSSGAADWVPDGVQVCWSTECPQLVSDGQGGAIICAGRWVCRVNSDGIVVWSADLGAHRRNWIISDGRGGAVVITVRSAGGGERTKIWVARVDANGGFVWGPKLSCATSEYQDHPSIINCGDYSAIIAWQDNRDSNWDVYAQRLDFGNGDCLWDPEGVPVCTATSSQEFPQLGPDGSGGAFVVWNDMRSGSYDIYAHCIDSTGTIESCPGCEDGVCVCNASRAQDSQRVAFAHYSGGRGHAIVAWADFRNSASHSVIYADMIRNNVCEVVPTLLREYSCDRRGSAIVIRWSLAQAGEEMDFSIYRAEGPDGTFRQLADLPIVREGMSFTFEDGQIGLSQSYAYRIDVSDDAGRRVLFETEAVSVPSGFWSLYQNRPNPFNPMTTISFMLREDSHVKLSVYNAEGKLVRTLVDEVLNTGFTEVSWDGTDAKGTPVSSGVYFYRLNAGKQVLTKKMTLIK